MHSLAEEIAAEILSSYPVVRCVNVHLQMPRALLRADNASVNIWRGKDFPPKIASMTSASGEPVQPPDIVGIQNISLYAVIGLNACERLENQKLRVSLEFLRSSDSFNYQTICRSVEDLVTRSKFKTIELLALTIARCCIVDCCVSQVHFVLFLNSWMSIIIIQLASLMQQFNLTINYNLLR